MDIVAIRPIGMGDVCQTYADWLRDPLVNRYLETRHSEQTIASVAAFVRAMMAHPDQHLFAICVGPDAKHVGNIKIGPIVRPHGLADISLFVGERSAWGRGVATAAIRLATRFGFEQLGLQKLSASVYAPNVASAKAFLRVGYSQEGHRRKHFRMGEERVDCFEFGMCAEDPATKEAI
jgi:ribosomal-protein-alanine N-acetyltransferase